MKKLLPILVILFIVCCSITGYSQNVAINATGTPAAPTAILDISSNSKGVLVPRMNSTERNMILSPAQGLLVYDLETRKFWFYDGGWNQINSGGSLPSGPASGDLSGSYPSPNVAKIQNLDIAFGVPNDKQVLKWDALANNWKGRNDSLFLPYNVAFGNAGKLFGIQNNNTSSGSSAIAGKSGSVGSGVTPSTTMGVWGDNSNGLGVVGTSSAGIGTYGLSLGNHGVYGYSSLANFAGVCGSHANAGGIGVLGDIQNSGKAIFGRSTATSGKAGYFINTNSENTDTTVFVNTAGKGTLAYFSATNSQNDKAAIEIQHAGNGNGIKLRQTKTNSPANALDVVASGNGYGIYGRSDNSTAARFENTNATNVFPVISMSNNSLGTLMSINSSNTGITGNVIDVTNSGQGRALSVNSARGNAGYFNMTDVTSTAAGVSVQHTGLGRGQEIVLTKTTNTQAGLWVNTAGTLGIHSNATSSNSVAILGAAGAAANDAVGVKGTTATNVMNGIGVLGQAGASDPNGIGVKGIAGGAISGGIGVFGEGLSSNPQAIGVKGVGYTHNEDVGAVTGINMTDGVGVYGESLGFDGIGVAGTVGNTNNHSVAGVFTNNYTENNRSVVEINTNGKGAGLTIDHNNLANAAPLMHMLNSGNGQFMRLENGLGDIKTTISKEGNLTTDGTITVKTDKGIVRNSSSTQLRMEILNKSFPAGTVPHYDEFNAPAFINVTFGTAFSSAPAVSLAQEVSGGIGLLTLSILDVTTTGFTIELFNYTGYNWDYPATTLKFIIVGAE
jgi:hypothetical protein